MNYKIQEIQKEDDSVVCEIIQKVGAEYGAVGDGFGPSDPEVLCMSKNYDDTTKSRYLIVKIEGEVVGGCGVAPFNKSTTICELKKLFLLPDSRGLGLGRKLTEQCLNYAKLKGFKSCYLDTLQSMTSAVALYESIQFRHLDKPLEGTEHNGCNVWMLKDL